MSRLMILLLALTLPMTAMAVEPDEILEDPVLEARAREVSRGGLRCVVCLNQDIDSSNAGVARDLRLLVRERIVAGDSNSEALAFIQARYGDYVLLKPPLNTRTYVLWLAPPGDACDRTRLRRRDLDAQAKKGGDRHRIKPGRRTGDPPVIERQKAEKDT